MSKTKYTVEVVKSDLEIDERLDLQERGWIIQKVGWVFIVAIMIAAALGVFGTGVLSKEKIAIGGVSVEFEKYYRYETEMKLLVESSDHISTISFPQQYLKGFRIIRFVPEPFSNNTVNNIVKYNFLPGQNHIVSVYLIPKEYGGISGTMRVNEINNLQLHHFIYP